MNEQDLPEDQRMKKMTITGCSLWIIGLIVFIVGINLTGNTRETMMTLGSIIVLMGLVLSAIVWMKKKSDSDK